MKNLQNSINVSIFAALKVSELSKVPVLIMSNPGLGKSTSVEMFAKVRNYELELLRGNSTTAEEVLGYDVADTSEDSKTTKHLRPSWYTKILDNQAAGKKTLLFLDELTTANDYVQSALLHLIFERKVGSEYLPQDTLIVSAGNYAQNLSNGMNLLPPLMNRFLIYNIESNPNDLDSFLCKYSGALVNKPIDFMSELNKTMTSLDSQELKIEESSIGKIGEYFEQAIKKTTKTLMTSGEKLIDLNVKDLQGIYSDATGDNKLYGFVSYRTLNYLREVALHSYLSFGKDGISSDNFTNMVEGLCGIGLSKDTKSNIASTKVNIVADYYINALKNATNDVIKLSVTRLPIYDNFFLELINSKKIEVPTSETLSALINKLKEMRADNDLKNLDRPIREDLVKSLCDGLVKSGKSILKKIKFDSNSGQSITEQVPVETMVGAVSIWNLISDSLTEIKSIVNDSSLNYDESTKTSIVQSSISALSSVTFKLKTAVKAFKMADAAEGAKIPELRY